MTLNELATREAECRWGPGWQTVVLRQLEAGDAAEKAMERWREWFRANPDCLIGHNPEYLGPRVRS